MFLNKALEGEAQASQSLWLVVYNWSLSSTVEATPASLLNLRAILADQSQVSYRWRLCFRLARTILQELAHAVDRATRAQQNPEILV